jgi:hypothetical protein
MSAVAMAQGFASFAMIVVLLASNTAVCAGWAATPQARMACCAGGDDACPMHKGKSHDSAEKYAISQTQADACCAASEQQHSNQSAQAHTSVMSSAVLGAGVIVPVPIPALVARDGWRTAVPNPTAPIPKHVLLSVFLV